MWRTCEHVSTWAGHADQICTQVKASFSPFGHLTQVNVSWVTSINLLLANEIQVMSAWKWFSCDLRGNLPVRLATQRKSLRKFNLRPLATTCRSVWPGLNVLKVLKIYKTRAMKTFLFHTYCDFRIESIAWKAHTEISSSNHNRETIFPHVGKAFHPIGNQRSKFATCSRCCS